MPDTLSKQPLGTWPCGTGLISSMEFPPNSVVWPQHHRFDFSASAEALPENKPNPSDVRWSLETWWLQPYCSWFGLQLGSCSWSHVSTASCTAIAHALICLPWEPAGFLQATDRPQTDADTNGCRMEREWVLLSCYRHRAPCWAVMSHQGLKWVQVLKWTEIETK